MELAPSYEKNNQLKELYKNVFDFFKHSVTTLITRTKHLISKHC